MRKTLALLILIFLFSGFVFAEEEEITIHFFEQKGCPDCARQKEFLDEIKDKYPETEIIYYDITQKESIEQLHFLAEKYSVENYWIMVPTTFVNEVFFQGFSEKDKNLIEKTIKGEDFDSKKTIISLPIFGEIDRSGWSLPLITVILGSLDGLNVCSIGALILILMFVLSFKSRKKVIFFGGLFILTATLIYGLLVFVWTTLIEYFIGHLEILNIIVGLAALGGGVFYFREFLQFYRFGPTCKSGSNKFAAKVTERMKKAFNNEIPKGTLFLAGSVAIFAAVITLIELPCSVALPVIFSSILVESKLSLVAYLFYIILYLFFFMLIEIIIFIGAIITKEIWIAESKMITWVYLVGSLVLFFLAFHYLKLIFY